jgi:hypothetical protein
MVSSLYRKVFIALPKESMYVYCVLLIFLMVHYVLCIACKVTIILLQTICGITCRTPILDSGS